MNTARLKQARKLWNNRLCDPSLNRANQRKWVRAVRAIGSNWLLAGQVPRLGERNA